MSQSIAADRCRVIHGKALLDKVHHEWQPVMDRDFKLFIAWAKCDECQIMHVTKSQVDARTELSGGTNLLLAIRDKTIQELRRYLGAERQLTFGDIYQTMMGERASDFITPLKPFAQEATDGKVGTPPPTQATTV